MAQGLQFKENLTLISGGYPHEDPGSSGVVQDWTDTTGTSGSTTTTYWYNDSALMTNTHSTRVELNITDTWSAQLMPGNVYRITVTTVINSIRRYKVGNPQPLTVAIFARQTAGGPNIWTSGGCINAAIDANIATNINMGTYYFDLPPESTGSSRGTVYYRSNICGHDGDVPPSIYVDEFWMGINFRNLLPKDYRPGKTWNGSDWKSHDRSSGWSGVWDNSSFKEMRTVDGGTGTGNPPTLKHNDGWKNQRRIGSM